MNTFEQMFKLNDKLHSILDKNKGIVELTFYDGSTLTIRVLSTNTDYNFNERSYVSTIITFTNDVNKTTKYNFGTVRDIN